MTDENTYEPEFELPDSDPGDEQPPAQAPAPELDYDRLATAVAEKMRPARQEPQGDDEDLDDLFYSDRAAYHKRITERATQAAIQQLAPQLAGASMYAQEALTRDMDDDAKAVFTEMLKQEFGGNAAAVATNPVIADLVRDAARFRAGTRRVPGASPVGRGGGSEYGEPSEVDRMMAHLKTVTGAQPDRKVVEGIVRRRREAAKGGS